MKVVAARLLVRLFEGERQVDVAKFNCECFEMVWSEVCGGVMESLEIVASGSSLVDGTYRG